VFVTSTTMPPIIPTHSQEIEGSLQEVEQPDAKVLLVKSEVPQYRGESVKRD
jgi:hypothetical protein